MLDGQADPTPRRVTAAAGAADLGSPLARAEALRLAEVAAVVLVVALAVIPSGAAVWLSYAVDLPGGVAAALVVGLMFGAPLTALLLLNRRSRRTVFHLFERGAVLDRPGQPDVRLLHWPDILPHERIRTIGVGQSSTPRDEWSLVIRDRSGKDVFTGFGTDSLRLTEAIAEAELARARAALAAGEAVRYGPFTVTPHALVVDGRELPWAEVGDVRVAGYSVEVFEAGASARVLERRPRRSTPHQRTLVALAGGLAGGRSAHTP